jgi:chemotaxis protein methyltransferase CheR
MTTATLSDDSLTFVCKLVRDQSAIELEASKSYLIEARLAPVAKQFGFASTSELIHDLKSKQRVDVQRRVVSAMTTNETSFFRDIHPFDTLRKVIVPEFRAKRATQRALNIWSCACSTGQELYSIAMLIREHFPDLASWKIDLLGTDLSDEVLDRAQKAQFTQIEVNRGLSAPLLLKNFQRAGMNWELKPEIKSMASFRKLNLIENWPALPKMDVVFLRNVLIYFSPDTKKTILKKIRQVMAPDGVLFLGAAETTMNLDTSFERTQIDNGVFYRLK